MSTNYHNQLTKDYEKLLLEIDDLKLLITNMNSTIKMLNDTIQTLNDSMAQKDELNQKLLLEIERLKNNNNKNSSNSGKPSSKNGFKKVHNSREKTSRKPGGQKGHTGKTSNVTKMKQLIETGKAKHIVIEVNKSEQNQHQTYQVRYVQDIEVTTIIKEYRYYPNDTGDYAIPKTQHNIATYGENVKSFGMMLIHKLPTSMDQAVELIRAITDEAIDLPKSSLVNWSNTLSEKFSHLLEEIRQGLHNATYVHTDESPININGKTYQLHNYSNDQYTLQYVHQRKSKEAMEQLGFLPNYVGTLIHDHNKVQYNFGTKHGECNAHILRYLKAVTEFTKHAWAQDMSEYLKDILHQKHLAIEAGVDAFTIEQLTEYNRRYDEILKQASRQYQADYATNAYEEDERRLINRLEDYKANHLLFVYDFKIPFTNNRAETDIRPTKRKLNIGIFRSEDGAKDYIQIRSCLSTFMKNKLNIFQKIIDAFADKSLSLIAE